MTYLYNYATLVIVKGGEIILTVIDVIRALSKYITDNYPKYPIDDRDISDTVDRPCSFIDVDDMNSDIYAVGYVRDTASIDVYIFVEDLNTGFLELLDCKNDMLQWLNNPIELVDENNKVGGYVTPNNVTATISKADKALRVSFDVELIQALEDKSETGNPYVMEDLSLSFKEDNY